LIEFGKDIRYVLDANAEPKRLGPEAGSSQILLQRKPVSSGSNGAAARSALSNSWAGFW
jgi:hypothetical protein